MPALRRVPLLIYLLALALVCLSTRAKLAQYGTASLTHTPEITKATKLAEGRHDLSSDAVISAVTPAPCPGKAPAETVPGRSSIRVVTPSCWDPAAVRPPPPAA